MSKLIFLGGTVANNKWRGPLIKELMEADIPNKSIFNPVVDDWNEEAQKKEEEAKANAFLSWLSASRGQSSFNILDG